MPTLNDPITAQNILDRYSDYLRDRVNSGIVWGTNALPFPEFDSASFGGDTVGQPTSIVADYTTFPLNYPITPADGKITASNIFEAVFADAAYHTVIRNLRALLFVEGTGGNIGTRPDAGYIYDATYPAYLNSSYVQSMTYDELNRSDVSANQVVTATGLETFFNNMAALYESKRTNAATIQVNVCHASCHSSCHGSRGRR